MSAVRVGCRSQSLATLISTDLRERGVDVGPPLSPQELRRELRRERPPDQGVPALSRDVDVVGVVQIVSVFVGTGVASALVSKVTEDVYDALKNALRSWRQGKTRRDPEKAPDGFVIYGPDGTPLERWRGDRKG